MSALDAGVTGAAWLALLWFIGGRKIGEVLEDYYEGLRRDCEPWPRRVPPRPAQVVSVRHPARRSPPAVSVAAMPLVRPLRAPTVEELEAWFEKPDAPSPKWLVP